MLTQQEHLLASVQNLESQIGLSIEEQLKVYLKNPNSPQARLIKQEMDFLESEIALLEDARKLINLRFLKQALLAEANKKYQPRAKDEPADANLVKTKYQDLQPASKTAWVDNLLQLVAKQVDLVNNALRFINSQLARIREQKHNLVYNMMVPALEKMQQQALQNPIVYAIPGARGPVNVHLHPHLHRVIGKVKDRYAQNENIVGSAALDAVVDKEAGDALTEMPLTNAQNGQKEQLTMTDHEGLIKNLRAHLVHLFRTLPFGEFLHLIANNLAVVNAVENQFEDQKVEFNEDMKSLRNLQLRRPEPSSFRGTEEDEIEEANQARTSRFTVLKSMGDKLEQLQEKTTQFCAEHNLLPTHNLDYKDKTLPRLVLKGQ